jgi:hypothetical protein
METEIYINRDGLSLRKWPVGGTVLVSGNTMEDDGRRLRWLAKVVKGVKIKGI